MAFGLSNRKDEVAVYLDGETFRETSLGSGGQVFGLGLVTFEMPYTHLN